MGQCIITRRGGSDKFVYSEHFTIASTTFTIQLNPSKQYLVRAVARTGGVYDCHEYSVAGGAITSTIRFHNGAYLTPTIDSSGVLKPFSANNTDITISLCIIEI